MQGEYQLEFCPRLYSGLWQQLPEKYLSKPALRQAEPPCIQNRISEFRFLDDTNTMHISLGPPLSSIIFQPILGDIAFFLICSSLSLVLKPSMQMLDRRSREEEEAASHGCVQGDLRACGLDFVD